MYKDRRSRAQSSNDQQGENGNHTEETQRGPSPKQPNVGETNNKDKTNIRTRWNKEEMKEVVWCFLASTGNYKEAYELWRSRNLQLRPTINAKLLLNQKNYILKNKKLTDIEIDEIRESINAHTEDSTGDHARRKEDDNVNTKEDETQDESTREEIEQNVDRTGLKEQLQIAWYKVRSLQMSERRRLPKLEESKKLVCFKQQVNGIIKELLEENQTDITEVNHLIYAAATVITETTIKPRKTMKTGRFKDFWKIRIQKQISNWRKDLSILTESGSGSDNIKLNTKKRKIFQKYKVTNAREVAELIEKLKQKIQAKAQRIRRYEKRKNQYIQNKMFKENTNRFYRHLGAKAIEVTAHPSMKEVELYWQSIWEVEARHNEKAEWISREEKGKEGTKDMKWTPIKTTEFTSVLSKTHNWKSPGSDQIQNYWLKAFPVTHSYIIEAFNKIIEKPQQMPEWLTAGITYLLPKSKSTTEPRNYRPITCLSTMYKMLTGIIARRISLHLEEHNLLPEEQKGCHPGSKGCKDQLLISKAILEDCSKRKKNLNMAWIDYQKAFDRVPHSWIGKSMELVGVNDSIVKFCKHSMEKWNTKLQLRTNQELMQSQPIKINRGIFQGDSLSPLLFCIALIPLTHELNRSGCGYQVHGSERKISHLLYMDDLKLLGKSEEELRDEIKIVKTFSNDIKMEFGLEKCARILLKKVRFTEKSI